MESANVSASHNGCTHRYCTSELLLPGKRMKDPERKPTDKSDLYSLSMVVVKIYTLCGNVEYPGSGNPSPSLRPGRNYFLMPYERDIPTIILEGKRPSEPDSFETAGISPEVWRIAKRYYHEKEKKRLGTNVVLEDPEALFQFGVYARRACTCSLWSSPKSNGDQKLPRAAVLTRIAMGNDSRT